MGLPEVHLNACYSGVFVFDRGNIDVKSQVPRPNAVQAGGDSWWGYRNYIKRLLVRRFMLVVITSAGRACKDIAAKAGALAERGPNGGLSKQTH